MRQKMNKLYGWFSSLEEGPDYDPPHDAPCPYCGDPLTPDDVRTHSFVGEKAEMCYFYRTHRTCDDVALEGAQQSILGGIIEQITAHK